MGENELMIHESNLPATLDDLSKFVLVGREKLTSVMAEIRAIDKLGLAEQVRSQKLKEARIISEAIVDAEVKLGELLSKLPRGSGRRKNTNVQTLFIFKEEKTKAEAIKELGFSKTLAHYFETLAHYKDKIEQLKAETEINEPLPSRTKILKLIQGKDVNNSISNKNKISEQNRQIKNKVSEDSSNGSCDVIYKKFNIMLNRIEAFENDLEHLRKLSSCYNDPEKLDQDRQRLNETVSKLMYIQQYLNRLQITVTTLF